MGNCYAPLLFNLDYCSEIREWTMQLRHRVFLTKDPATGRTTDLGMQLFIDDVVRLFGQGLGQSHS